MHRCRKPASGCWMKYLLDGSCGLTSDRKRTPVANQAKGRRCIRAPALAGLNHRSHIVDTNLSDWKIDLWREYRLPAYEDFHCCQSRYKQRLSIANCTG